MICSNSLAAISHLWHVWSPYTVPVNDGLYANSLCAVIAAGLNTSHGQDGVRMPGDETQDSLSSPKDWICKNLPVFSLWQVSRVWRGPPTAQSVRVATAAPVALTPPSTLCAALGHTPWRGKTPAPPALLARCALTRSKFPEWTSPSHRDNCPLSFLSRYNPSLPLTGQLQPSPLMWGQFPLVQCISCVMFLPIKTYI